MNEDVLGYDCDGLELYEFDIVRAIWYSDIDFSETTDVDPRQYCVVKSLNGKCYLVSVYDHWDKTAINKFENREENEAVPIKIRPIEEACNYERAQDCDNNLLNYRTINSEDSCQRLIRKINEI